MEAGTSIVPALPKKVSTQVYKRNSPLPALRVGPQSYHVGVSRARAQVRLALETQDGPAQLRRLNQALDNRCLKDVGDTSTQGLLRVAEDRTMEVTRRIREKSHYELRHGDDGEIGLSKRPIEVCKLDCLLRGRAPKGSAGDYVWLRQSNTTPDRQARQEIAALTLKAMRCHGYMLGESRMVELTRIKDMLHATKLVSPSCGLWPKPEDAPVPLSIRQQSTKVSVVHSVVLEEALQLARRGHRVAAVSAASAYHLGGGFLSGGRHALEEATCVQSTLYESLNKAVSLVDDVPLATWVKPKSKPSGEAWTAHIPQDGVILSPYVEVFRSGTNDGYEFLKNATALEAVISVAMPNCNKKMSDSPVDAHPDAKVYEEQLKTKWLSVLTAAAHYTAAEVLVIPDAGCGVFRNEPGRVGAALGDLLRPGTFFASRFLEVIIAFPGAKDGQEFADAAVATAREPLRKEPTPLPALPIEPTAKLCKFGCNRIVDLEHYDTCCGVCASCEGGGEHDPLCDERTAAASAQTAPALNEQTSAVQTAPQP